MPSYFCACCSLLNNMLKSIQAWMQNQKNMGQQHLELEGWRQEHFTLIHLGFLSFYRMK